MSPRPRAMSPGSAVPLVAAALVWAACSSPPAPQVGETPAPSSWRDATHAPRAVLLDSGATYFRTCSLCHGQGGRGDRGPALANADVSQGDPVRMIRSLLTGVNDTVRVNGTLWRGGEMPALADALSDFEIAAVLTYVRAALNDSTVVSCVNDDLETGTFASCVKEPRSEAERSLDSVSVSEVAAARASLFPPGGSP